MITKAQQKAILQKFRQSADGATSYLQFRRRAQLCTFLGGVIMLPWCGMIVGIETDGYAHT